MKNLYFKDKKDALLFVSRVLLVALPLFLSACNAGSESRVSNNLVHLAKGQTVAILPMEISERGQKDAAAMFRRSLYANLVQAQFKVQERYLVDGLLNQAGLTDPAQYRKAGIARLGEILGVDAVIFSKIENVNRLYLIIHSSIDMGVSTEMVDTRTGEILWQGKENASEFSGIAKLPTGMIATVTAPIYFVTNKLNLRKMTSEMTDKMTSAIRNPDAQGKKAAPIQEARKPAGQTQQAKMEVAQAPKTEAKNAGSKSKRADQSAQSTEENAGPSFFYTLQVGAYQSKAFAENMIRNLASKGYNTFLSMLENGNSTLYKVQVERFDNADKALVFSKELETREQIHAFTLKINTN
jgi:hypothetical protein